MGKKQPETILQKEIKTFLNLQPDCHVARIKNGATYDPTRKVMRANTTDKGIPDIMGVGPGGWHMSIEVKTPGRKSTLTTEQRLHLDNINKKGGFGVVADSIKDVELLLERMRFMAKSIKHDH